LSDFQTGLLISVVGLVVTFSALLIFVGVIVLLQKLFPVKAEKEEEGQFAEETVSTVVTETSADDSDEIAAAIAAVSYLRSQRAGQLGASLLYGPGPYRGSN
jgi:Na+-transporting methylmalonyl-CoA/oxaloacetate decarboxylase gamma subunit